MRYSELLRKGVRSRSGRRQEFARVDPRDLLDTVVRAAKTFGVPAELLLALADHESRWDPGAVSPKGGRGLFQITPIAETDIRQRFGIPVNVWDPKSATYGAAAYLRWLMDQFPGDLTKVLAAWNWGYGNVVRHGVDRLPQETQALISDVLSLMPKYRKLISEKGGAEPTQQAGRPAWESNWRGRGLSLVMKEGEGAPISLPSLTEGEAGEAEEALGLGVSFGTPNLEPHIPEDPNARLR